MIGAGLCFIEDKPRIMPPNTHETHHAPCLRRLLNAGEVIDIDLHVHNVWGLVSQRGEARADRRGAVFIQEAPHDALPRSNPHLHRLQRSDESEEANVPCSFHPRRTAWQHR